MLLRPKNWEVFQHYKDRSPPWIKLHRDLLTNRDFICLPTASKALAPLLWLLASESKDGSFDAAFDELEFRLRISRKDYDDGLKPLIDKGFFIVASGMLAECYQVAIPETEREGERETEKETDIQPSAVVAHPADARLPSCPTEKLLEMYHRHLPMLPRVEVMNDGRRKTLAARWRDVISDKEIRKTEDPKTSALEFFDWYFEHASKSPFLTGKLKSWRADFDFLITASKFAKVIEGHYHKEVA